MRLMIMIASIVFVVIVVVPLPPASAQDSSESATVSQWDEETFGPLPRWRVGGTPKEDPNQSLYPFAIKRRQIMRAPTSGVMSSPPEYSPSKGLLFRYSSGAWPQVNIDLVSALTGDPAHDDIAYVLVSNTSQQTIAENQFSAAGADLSKVEFIIEPTNSIWIRDYGPHFVWQADTIGVADSHYYPNRPLDNFIPTLVADDDFEIPSYDMGVYYSGGNFQPGPNRTGYMTSLVMLDNAGFSEEYLIEQFSKYQGVDTLYILPKLPWSVDGTGHIDMWFYLVDEDTVIISEFLPGENATAIQITNNAADFMEAEGFEVFRVPDSNEYHPYDSQCHFTYTNAFRVNDRIFIPTYGQGNPAFLAQDAQSLAAWQAAAPEAEIIPINSYDIIYAAGAIHCIMMQVPLRTDPLPSVHVISPIAGDVVMSGSTFDVEWAAADDDIVVYVDLFYSDDGGQSFPHEIGLLQRNDGHFKWAVPEELTVSGAIKVVARDMDGNVTEAIGEGSFQISAAPQTVYDFSSGAGVDKWGWGYQTISWSELQGVRMPAGVATEISTLQSGAYDKIAFSDADGSDSDPNRYSSPIPSSGRESTHIFEFTIAEDPASIVGMDLIWEGYADDCTQMELYVWDYVGGDWCDGLGLSGQNRYADNFAGNRDATLRNHIRAQFNKYIDVDGTLTMLLYAERYGDKSFHDYLAVVVTHSDADLDGVGDAVDNCPNHFNLDQADCDDDGIGDICAIAEGISSDENENGIPDNCEVPSCVSNEDCIDEFFCNGAETCNLGTGECESGADPCAPPNFCNDDLDACVECLTNENCADGSICNGEETCDALGNCQPGTPLTCVDNDVCNGTETCDSVKGCQAGTPLMCDNGLFCDGVETCDAGLGCQDGPDPCKDPKLPLCDEEGGTCEPDVAACVTNLDCQDADPCVRAICDTGSGTCANHPRFYGDLNHDGVKNIVDLVCESRVAFQGLTVCNDFQVDEAEVDYGPNDAGCGDGIVNIVDVIITARIAFQNLDDDCCGVSSALSCSEVTGGAPHCP